MEFVSAHCGILKPCEFQVTGNVLTRWSIVSALKSILLRAFRETGLPRLRYDH